LNKIVLENTAKRYIKEWVFREFSYTFEKNNAYVILGSNGSGKSTLLQIVSSYLSPTKGKVEFYNDGNLIDNVDLYKTISFATPYMELPEEFTLSEVIDFHLKFKKFSNGISKQKFIDICYLNNAIDKVISNFSSGMKQRLKIALAILSDTKAVFLDEPTSNLDRKGIEWYKKLIVENIYDRIIVVCSNNIEDEFFFCNHFIQIEDFKKSSKLM
jgi:ABC-type multidrug transport system ATPase subunit